MGHQTSVICGCDGVSEHARVDKHDLRFKGRPSEGEQLPQIIRGKFGDVTLESRSTVCQRLATRPPESARRGGNFESHSQTIASNPQTFL